MSTYIVSAGTTTRVIAGDPTGQYIVEGGTLAIESGGMTRGTQVKSGFVSVSSGGRAYRDIVSGGTEIIREGGIASAAVVRGSGRQVLSNGGRSIAAIVRNGGREIVDPGGIASGSVVSNGGRLVVHGGAQVVGLIVSSGGTVELAGGLFTGIVVSGGIEAVTTAANHRVYRDLRVSIGVTLSLSSGGETNATIVEAGGLEIVGRGGSEGHATVVSGGKIVFAGGTATVTADSGSTIGLASGTRIDGRTIGRGVTLVVSSGASATSTRLGAGATEIVAFGGSIGDTTTMGANTVLDVATGNASSKLTVSGFGSGDTIELGQFTQAQPSWQYMPIVGSLVPGGVLSITAESHTTSVLLFGQYVAAGFRVNDIAQNVLITYSPVAAEPSANIAAGHYLAGH